VSFRPVGRGSPRAGTDRIEGSCHTMESPSSLVSPPGRHARVTITSTFRGRARRELRKASVSPRSTGIPGGTFFPHVAEVVEPLPERLDAFA